MENELLRTFGQIIKTSRNSGIDILSELKRQKPKNPSEEQVALLELINTLNSKEQELLKKGIKYCVELSLFKMINTLEYGVSDYYFYLKIKKGNDSISLIDDEVDHDLTREYWNWMR